MKRWVLVLACIAVLAAAAWFWASGSMAPKVTEKPTLNYTPVDTKHFRVSLFAENMGSLTRIRFTPDGDTMLVSTLNENIYAFHRVGDKFVKQEKPFFSLKTGLPGFPPEESGLSGMVLGADFETSGDIFLLYTANEKEQLKNRVTRITFKRDGDDVIGTNPTLIFEGNTISQPSHQIQGGVGVMIGGVGHLMFNVGDAVEAKNAHDLSKEAGKVMLIKRDGGAPLGPRPFPQNPKIQAIGLRNAFDLALNPFDPLGRFILGDTGTGNNDRLIYGKLLDTQGKSNQGIDLQWDGNDPSLEKSILDLNTSGTPEMVLHRFAPTQTIDDAVFFEGGWGRIPKSDAKTSNVLLSIWGQTGSTNNTPGKKILLGKLDISGSQPRITLSDFIVRSELGQGKMGHPLGLAVDPKTSAIYFGDIIEGNIYKVEPIN